MTLPAVPSIRSISSFPQAGRREPRLSSKGANSDRSPTQSVLPRSGLLNQSGRSGDLSGSYCARHSHSCPDQELQLPEIAPLGPGFADTYLRLVSASGSTLTTAGSSGLREIGHASRFKDEEFGDVPGTISRAFHVERTNWSLKVQIPSAADEGSGTASEFARVVSADVEVVMLPDRSLRGRAVYETQAHTGRFLVAELPPGGTLLWTTVDQRPTAALRSGEGRWLIPLGEQQGPSRVSLFWSDRGPNREIKWCGVV